MVKRETENEESISSENTYFRDLSTFGKYISIVFMNLKCSVEVLLNVKMCTLNSYPVEVYGYEMLGHLETKHISGRNEGSALD